MPSFGAFRTRLEEEFHCNYKTLDGDPFPINYFERIHDGKKLQCTVYFKDDDVILTPIVLSNICRRLKIDSEHFGFNLGWLEDVY